MRLDTRLAIAIVVAGLCVPGLRAQAPLSQAGETPAGVLPGITDAPGAAAVGERAAAPAVEPVLPGTHRAARAPLPSRTGGISFDAALALYTAADYDGAMAMLDQLLLGRATQQDLGNIELYRALCLVATGQEAAAVQVLEGLIAADPLYRPSADLPPRVRTMFDEARRELLPSTIQMQYLMAKAAFDRDDHAAAAAGFDDVLELLDDPGLGEDDTGDALSDLRMLAEGFQRLSLEALSPDPGPAPVPVPSATPRLPSGRTVQTLPAPADRLYSAVDRDIVPPLTLEQQIPPYPGRLRSTFEGVLEVVIDETGAVESAEMLDSIEQNYDRLALEAAETWRYEPATINGVPVRFTKRIRVSIVPDR